MATRARRPAITRPACDRLRFAARLALDVATPYYHMKPGIIAVPLDATENSQILLLSMLINTTPGSVALDVSPDRKTLYVHVMYMDTPDAAREEIKQGFERRVLGGIGACRFHRLLT